MERVTEDESEVEPRLVDLRWGFDRLAGVAEERIGRKARGGALFVFFGKRRDALKVLFEVRPGAKRAAGVH